MITDEMDVVEMLEHMEKKGYKVLDEMKEDDPNRTKKLNEVETYAKLRLEHESNENARLNNNARNDIDEQKVEIEAQKARNDAKRIWVDVIKGGMYVGFGFLGGVGSYLLDPWFSQYKPFQRLADQIRDLAMKK